MKKRTHSNKAAKHLSNLIEEERRKIGELAFDRLSSPDVIQSMEKLEQMINEYTAMVYVGKWPSGPTGNTTK